jgi:hypothetical protein
MKSNCMNNEVPVLDFIVSLNPKQQAKIYREIELLTLLSGLIIKSLKEELSRSDFRWMRLLHQGFCISTTRLRFCFIYLKNNSTCILLL